MAFECLKVTVSSWLPLIHGLPSMYDSSLIVTDNFLKTVPKLKCLVIKLLFELEIITTIELEFHFHKVFSWYFFIIFSRVKIIIRKMSNIYSNTLRQSIAGL